VISVFNDSTGATHNLQSWSKLSAALMTSFKRLFLAVEVSQFLMSVSCYKVVFNPATVLTQVSAVAKLVMVLLLMQVV
jgi:hypothetical protein